MGKDIVLEEARRLHALGFAIHWLRPRSKIPLESGWTTGPRKDWEYLERTYRPGLNVGTRLGTPSEIRGNFLFVIDVDVKSDREIHRLQAIDAARELERGENFPTVLSGRGGGSGHSYGLSRKPFKTFTYRRSPDRIELFSPSKKPSKEDYTKLGAPRVNEGYRISYAWEVAVYSEGRQVVLPPSVHPDTGATYEWAKPFGDVHELPVITLPDRPESVGAEKVGIGAVNLDGFKPEPIELAWLPISDEVRNAIVSGEGVTDRSAYLMRAWRALSNAGLSQNEILTILTDPVLFLGNVGYEHAHTESRQRAAEWLLRFTGMKVEAEKTSVEVFRKLPIPEITEEEPDTFYETGPKGKLKPAYNRLLQRFEKEHAYRSVSDMKTVFIFNGTHYEDVTPIEIKSFAERLMDPKPESRVRNEFLDKVLVNNVARRRFFIDTTEGKINFKNGILGVGSDGAKLMPHSPKVGFRGVLPYGHDPTARCPTFEFWLDSVMLGDRKLVHILQEFMGYIVRGGEYTYHKALWLEGTGRNGKSTFIDVLKALIGIQNFSTLSIKSLVNDKFAGSDLDGKIANFSEETSPQELADSGPFKNLTGDGDMSAQKKFGDIYSFRNRAKLVMSYNTIPDLKDLSPGMLSRPIIVPFHKEIKESDQDHTIKRRLLAELPGIFNFALEGWKRLERQNRFTESDRSANALRKIQQESCNVYQWVQNYVKFTYDNTKRYRPGEVYTAYRAREKFTYNIISFGRRLNAHPEVRKRHSHSREGEMYWGMEFL